MKTWNSLSKKKKGKLRDRYCDKLKSREPLSKTQHAISYFFFLWSAAHLLGGKEPKWHKHG